MKKSDLIFITFVLLAWVIGAIRMPAAGFIESVFWFFIMTYAAIFFYFWLALILFKKGFDNHE